MHWTHPKVGHLRETRSVSHSLSLKKVSTIQRCFVSTHSFNTVQFLPKSPPHSLRRLEPSSRLLPPAWLIQLHILAVLQLTPIHIVVTLQSRDDPLHHSFRAQVVDAGEALKDALGAQRDLFVGEEEEGVG
jgi:hypothetical protein